MDTTLKQPVKELSSEKVGRRNNDRTNKRKIKKKSPLL